MMLHHNSFSNQIVVFDLHTVFRLSLAQNNVTKIFFYMVIPLVQLRANRCGATVCPGLERVCFATEIRI